MTYGFKLFSFFFFLCSSCIVLHNERALPPCGLHCCCVLSMDTLSLPLWVNNSKAAMENLFADYSPAIKVVPNEVKWQTHWLLEALSSYKRNSVPSLQCSSGFAEAPYLIRLVLIRLQMQSCICVSLLVFFEALSANNKPLSHLH